VLVLTTFDSDDLIRTALTAGAHGYLLKSTSGQELILGVKHVAANRHVLDPAIAGGIIAQLASRAQPAAPSAPAPLVDITARERDVLQLLATGHTNQAISDALHVSITTVKTHVGALYAKTGATSRVELARYATG